MMYMSGNMLQSIDSQIWFIPATNYLVIYFTVGFAWRSKLFEIITFHSYIYQITYGTDISCIHFSLLKVRMTDQLNYQCILFRRMHSYLMDNSIHITHSVVHVRSNDNVHDKVIIQPSQIIQYCYSIILSKSWQDDWWQHGALLMLGNKSFESKYYTLNHIAGKKFHDMITVVPVRTVLAYIWFPV